MDSTVAGVQRTGEVIMGQSWGVETCATHACTAGSAMRGGTMQQLSV